MRTLYFDCFSGISGDMALGALLDLGLDKSKFLNRLKLLGLDEFEIKFERANKNGISANKITVIEHALKAHSHSRSMADIERIIKGSELGDNVKKIALKVFYKIAEAEAKVHGVNLRDVHFHEVGAVDSIVDIVGCAICIDMLQPDRILSSPLTDGTGFVNSRHGLLPVPVPATLEICAQNSIPINQNDEAGEMVTPTGAGIIAGLAEGISAMVPLKFGRIGYGAGTRDFKRPNVLRVVFGEEYASEGVFLIETNIDDMTGELLAGVMDSLFEKGALDVWFENIYMKKNRPAVKLCVLADKNIEELEDTILRETTTFGMRKYEVTRKILEREFIKVKTPYGDVSVKVGTLGGIKKAVPEYEDCRALARAANVPVAEVYLSALENLKQKY